jgi:lambda family phage minor tail protein L
MPETVSNEFRDEKNKQQNRPISLYAVYVPGGTLYLAEYDVDVVFNSITYSKFPITSEAIPSNISGVIDSVKIKVSNVDKQMGAAIQANNGLRGVQVDMIFVFADLLDHADANLTVTLWIDSSAYMESDQTCEFLLTSRLDLYEVETPGRTFIRDKCQWEYKKEGCWLTGSPWTAPAEFLNSGDLCDKTKIGCKYHGNFLRFGGFESIPGKNLFFA